LFPSGYSLTPRCSGKYLAIESSVYPRLREGISIELDWTVGQLYNVLRQTQPIENFSPPVCVLRVLSKEDEALKTGMEAVVGQKGVIQGSPSWKDFRLILAGGASDTRFQPGKVSMSGYKTFFFSSILLNAAYTYSNKPVNESQVPVSYLVNDFGLLDGNAKTFKPYSIGGSDITTVEQVGLAKDGNFMQATQLVPIAFPGGSTIPVKASEMKGISGRKAAADGVFMEYFRDMIMPDKHIPISIAQRLFFRAFGDNVDQASRNFQAFMVGWSTLQHCEQGQALQHAFFCVNLAENCQGGIYPIFLGQVYRGSVIYGNFTMIVRYKEVKREAYDVYSKYIANLDLHAKRLAEIANQIESIKTADGSTKYQCTVAMIDTPKKFVDFYRTIIKEDLGSLIQDAIVEKADDLQYNDARYAEVSKKNILSLIKVARTGDKNEFRDLSPYFKGGILRRIHGNVSYAVSFFGPNPPSFSYSTGSDLQQFQIPKNNTDQDPNLLVKDGKFFLPYLSYKKVGISGAIDQWNHLLSTGKIRLPKGRQGKNEFTNKVLSDGMIHGKDFQETYDSLKAAVVDFASKDTATNKRKRADEVGEGSAKRRVEKVAQAEKLKMDSGDF
jgi:hypothetical protein